MKVEEILRSRNFGGDSRSVVPIPAVRGRRSGTVPIPASLLDDFFGVPEDEDDPASATVDTAEGISRRLVEMAIERLRETDHEAYRAINTVFNTDVGGYRDYEWYTIRRPELVEHVERGIDAIVDAIPPDRYALSVRLPRAYNDEEMRAHRRNHQRILDEWEELDKKYGMRSKDIADELADRYGCTPRYIKDIVAQARAERGEPKRPRGRPKKLAKD